MIRYALACRDGHAFESWFRNSSDFDAQATRKLVTCPVCGTDAVEKALMTPQLGRSAKKGAPAADAHVEVPATEASSAAAPAEPAGAETRASVALMSSQEVELRRKLKELRDHLVGTAEHVGPRFPAEARKMHYGEVEHRSIYGEASPDEVRSMLEEGIEFHPLPALPDERN